MPKDKVLTTSTTLYVTRPHWDALDLVLLDMDGTLLDLRFDNYFWLELVPERFAQHHGLTLEAAREVLTPRFAARQGTLDWYCTDYWSKELELDIAGLKREVREQVRYLPGAEQFLGELRRRQLQVVLVTNAHPDSLAIKAQQTGLLQYFDAAISSHRYQSPKEHPDFWQRLQAELAFDSRRVLFVDDSLAVLRAARNFGIAQVFAVVHSDSSQEPRKVEEFTAVSAVMELLDDRAA
jgi:putative hydrolase of the HAD superfamily